VGGSARGRRLAVPPGARTRPTSERAREGLFNTLATMLDLAGARFADLYAGSGAVGLEALSRGAAHALLVESDPVAARILRANVDASGLAGAEIRTAPVERVVVTTPGDAYDVLFLDPPYAFAAEKVTALLDRIAVSGWIDTNGVCVVERPSRSGVFRWPAGMIGDRFRGYGEGTLWYGFRS
jgi:16S rRNA (guanine966-N2)-methyltransferase